MTAFSRVLGPPPAWLWALTGSLAAHLALVSVWSPEPTQPRAARPASATTSRRVVPMRVSVLHFGGANAEAVIVRPAAPAERGPKGAAPARAPAAAETKTQAPAPAVAGHDAVPEGELVAAAPTAAAPEAAKANAPATGGSVSGVLPEGQGTAGAESEGGASSKASAGGEAGADSQGAAQQLHWRLAAAAARCYPTAARRYRQEGTTTVRFCLDAQGALVDFAVERSSGAGLLDAAARDCVVPAALPFPAAAGGCFSLPVRFGTQR